MFMESYTVVWGLWYATCADWNTILDHIMCHETDDYNLSVTFHARVHKSCRLGARVVSFYWFQSVLPLYLHLEHPIKLNSHPARSPVPKLFVLSVPIHFRPKIYGNRDKRVFRYRGFSGIEDLSSISIVTPLSSDSQVAFWCFCFVFVFCFITIDAFAWWSVAASSLGRDLHQLNWSTKW